MSYKLNLASSNQPPHWFSLTSCFLIGSSVPGMMIRPKGDQLEIRFSVSDPESWNGFVQNLNSFLTCETTSLHTWKSFLQSD